MIIAAIVVLLGIVTAAIMGVLNTNQVDFWPVMQYLEQFSQVVRTGAAIVKSFFVAPEIFDVLVATYIAVVVIYEGYKLVMWALAKIPMLSVHD